MSPLAYLRHAFLRRLLSCPEGRAHTLRLMVDAEEGDEAGVFDALERAVGDPDLARLIRRHRDDEHRHAAMYRECLERNGTDPGPVPDELRLIRRIGRKAGGAFARGIATREAVIRTPEEVMEVYALLSAIEQRGVEQFPLIGAAFRTHDPRTTDVFLAVAEDERRHVKYCQAIGRKYAPDEPTWQRAVARYRAIEASAFAENGLANMLYTIKRGIFPLRYIPASSKKAA